MNKNTFNEKVLAPLTEGGRLGEETNDVGTTLIGHTPSVAPKAYINIIYAPLDEGSFSEFEERYPRQLPPQYKQCLKYANGLSIFFDALRISGYIPLKRKGSHPHNYPDNFMMYNHSARMKGMKEDDAIVGWYKADGSHVLLDKKGRAKRIDTLGDGTLIQEWPDFDTWLTSEVAFLGEEYKAGRVEVFIPSLAKSVSSNEIVQ